MKNNLLRLMLCLPLSLLTFFSHATQFVDPAATTSWLGQGVQSQSGALKGKCLSGTELEFHNEAIDLGYRSSRSTMQSIREVTGSVSADVNLGLFGGGVSVSLHTRTEQNQTTASVVFKYSYVGKDITLHQRTLNTLGQSVVGLTPAQIEDVCGDEYIDHMQLGNDLYFVMQMVFSSTAEFEQFITRIRVRVLFWTSTTTIASEVFQFAQSGRYSVKVLSSNPLPQPIIDAIGVNGRISCQPSSSAAMQPCVTASNTIMNYLLASDGYQQWLADENNLGIVYFSSSSYEKTGHREFAGVVAKDTSSLNALHTQLLDALIMQYSYINTLEAFTEASAVVPIEYDTALITARANVALLDGALSSCRANPVLSSCQTQVNSAFAGLQAVDF